LGRTPRLGQPQNEMIHTNSLPIVQVPTVGVSHLYCEKLSAVNGVSGFTWSVFSNSSLWILSRLTESYLGFRRQKARRDTHLLLSTMDTVTPPSFNAKSVEVLQATSSHLVIAKRLVGSYRSGGNVKLAKSGSE